MQKQKILLIVVVLIVIGIVFAWIYGFNNNSKKVVSETDSWELKEDVMHGFILRYPNDFAERVGSATDKYCDFNDFSAECPDAQKILYDSIGAAVASKDFFEQVKDQLKPEKKVYGNNTFCVYSYNEGAAGTTYTNYFYVIAKNETCTILPFLVPYPNCQNYLPLETGNEEQKQNYENCLSENIRKPKILDQILSTFKFTN